MQGSGVGSVRQVSLHGWRVPNEENHASLVHRGKLGTQPSKARRGEEGADLIGAVVDKDDPMGQLFKKEEEGSDRIGCDQGRTL